MSTFALIGAAGYIAPRHMQAIKDTGNELVAAMDPNDTVGILDSYFPDARFFTEFERFDRYIDLLRRQGRRRRLSSASPRPIISTTATSGLRLRVGATAICEKPLVVNPWNAEALRDIEAESGRRVFTILQLRLHPSIVGLEGAGLAGRSSGAGRIELDLTYVTSRGSWYFASWKGEERKSGGIVPNIGIHFFDMLLWIFGPVEESEVTLLREDAASGILRFAGCDGALVPLGQCRASPGRLQGEAGSGPIARSPWTARRSSSPTASPTSIPKAIAESSRAKASESTTRCRASG